MTMLASSIPPTQQLGYLTNLLAEAEQLERAGNVVKAVHSYNEAILIPTKDGEALKSKELVILRVAQLLKSINDASGLDQFIRGLEPVWPFFPRAKSAKLVRDLLDVFDELSSVPASAQATQATKLELALIKDLIAWCVQDKRTFLKQSLESRLGSL